MKRMRRRRAKKRSSGRGRCPTARPAGDVWGRYYLMASGPSFTCIVGSDKQSVEMLRSCAPSAQRDFSSLI